MPSKNIKVKSILLVARNETEIFVFEGYDSVKKDYYYRPIGGTVEFGETSRAALKREVLEETGKEIKINKLVSITENIFTCDGVEGHEIVFVYEGDFLNQEIYKLDECWITEDNGEKLKCKWIAKENFIQFKLRLVPEDLVNKL